MVSEGDGGKVRGGSTGRERIYKYIYTERERKRNSV